MKLQNLTAARCDFAREPVRQRLFTVPCIVGRCANLLRVVLILMGFCGSGPHRVAFGDDATLWQPDAVFESNDAEPWTMQIVPDGLIYHSYIAGPREPRFSSVLLYDRNRRGWVWDSTLGARVGLIRYGTVGSQDVHGWQFDIEGAALPRLDVAQQEDVESVDYRFGGQLTWSNGPVDIKFGYFHISSHIGDEYLLRNPDFERINYVRESIVLGAAVHPDDNWRLYGETAFAFAEDGGAGKWQIQFGGEYAPIAPIESRGAPFVAMNVQLRDDVNFGGSFTAMTGWQWRNLDSNRSFRTGLMYFTGKSNQLEFFTRNDEQIGLGVWFDF